MTKPPKQHKRDPEKDAMIEALKRKSDPPPKKIDSDSAIKAEHSKKTVEQAGVNKVEKEIKSLESRLTRLRSQLNQLKKKQDLTAPGEKLLEGYTDKSPNATKREELLTKIAEVSKIVAEVFPELISDAKRKQDFPFLKTSYMKSDRAEDSENTPLTKGTEPEPVYKKEPK